MSRLSINMKKLPTAAEGSFGQEALTEDDP